MLLNLVQALIHPSEALMLIKAEVAGLIRIHINVLAVIRLTFLQKLLIQLRSDMLSPYRSIGNEEHQFAVIFFADFRQHFFIQMLEGLKHLQNKLSIGVLLHFFIILFQFCAIG